MIVGSPIIFSGSLSLRGNVSVGAGVVLGGVGAFMAARVALIIGSLNASTRPSEH